MPLNGHTRKELLGKKAGRSIAEESGKSPSQVSRVIAAKRRDPDVERIVCRRLRMAHKRAFPEFHTGQPLLEA